ncbi:putative mitochondrial hypothetical protein [Leptomonas pyrrhocoris]|uniref:Uncharacterized protein n=1 Tax=Leptomonas pyrrhocoris TaxID=157538 RepID=A0A0N1J5E9_LEPPY|nr:putative mitochondrial hypothetical protein [Leptomonas pyrrhocoris]KPA86064.1 putative mitochondrial hypothetical protein [Leptomonas pyrrhocoris]|eukprot:XP_015664503.1 putative mitochondrial hypothetical protein [Leptomonas pyrrhocoris]
MPCTLNRVQGGRALLLLIALLLLCIGCCLASSRQPHADDDAGATHPFCKAEFASSYFASIATTMPMADNSPVAQTGHLYVDQAAGAVRIDQFFRNHRTTFLLDNQRLRGFLFFGERDFQRTATTPVDDASRADDGDEGDEVRHHCHVFYLPSRVAPFCVPQSYTVDSRPSLVRGVAASRFTGMEGYPDLPLVEQSLYVINSSASINPDADVCDAPPPVSFIPWRLECRARPDLEPHKIAGAPYTAPNWRLFGHPMFDELVLSAAQETQLQFWQPTVDLLTMDFYDYYPTEHEADTFAVPPQCTAVLRHDTASGDDTTGRRAHDAAPQLQLATLQRFLLQWNLLRNVSVASISGEGSARTTLAH